MCKYKLTLKDKWHYLPHNNWNKVTRNIDQESLLILVNGNFS